MTLYLAIYGIVGLLVMGLGAVSEHRSGAGGDLRAMIRERKWAALGSWLLFLALLLVGWPLLLLAVPFVLILDHVRSTRSETEKPFVVRRRDLVARFDPDDIERAAHIADPLGAVPDLPFGHLNAAWRRFREDAPDNAEYWSFSARWTGRWSSEQREGYVLVVKGKPGRFFVASALRL